MRGAKQLAPAFLMLLAGCATDHRGQTADPRTRLSLIESELDPHAGPPPPPMQPTEPRHLSEIARMTPQELGDWLHTSWIPLEVLRIEVEQRTDRPHIWIHDAPRFDSKLGVCSLGSWELLYRTAPADGGSAGAADDPLIDPIGPGRAVKFRSGKSAADCNPGLPYSKWAFSMNDQTFASAVQAMREAVATVRPDGRSRLPIECEDRTAPGSHICDNPGQLLRRLLSVDPIAAGGGLWDGGRDVEPWKAAWILRFPAASSADATYVVTINGLLHPAAVRIRREAQAS